MFLAGTWLPVLGCRTDPGEEVLVGNKCMCVCVLRGGGGGGGVGGGGGGGGVVFLQLCFISAFLFKTF